MATSQDWSREERLGERIRIMDRGESVRVDIRSRHEPILLAFLAFWWIFWTVGGIAATVALVTGSAGDASAFLLLWLLFWAAAWVLVGTVWIWNLSGVEVVIADRAAVTTWGELFGRRFRRRDFRSQQITRLRAAGYFGNIYPWPRNWSHSLEWWGLAGGVIAFETDGNEQRFGIQLEEWEARGIVERLSRLLPETSA